MSQWLQLREMRNQFSHEYPDDPEIQASLLNKAFALAGANRSGSWQPPRTTDTGGLTKMRNSIGVRPLNPLKGLTPPTIKGLTPPTIRPAALKRCQKRALASVRPADPGRPERWHPGSPGTRRARPSGPACPAGLPPGGDSSRSVAPGWRSIWHTGECSADPPAPRRDRQWPGQSGHCHLQTDAASQTRSVPGPPERGGPVQDHDGWTRTTRGTSQPRAPSHPSAAPRNAPWDDQGDPTPPASARLRATGRAAASPPRRQPQGTAISAIETVFRH